MNPTDRLSASLEVQHWNQILAVLYETPAKISMPIILSLQEQLIPKERSANVVPMGESA